MVIIIAAHVVYYSIEVSSCLEWNWNSPICFCVRISSNQIYITILTQILSAAINSVDAGWSSRPDCVRIRSIDKAVVILVLEWDRHIQRPAKENEMWIIYGLFIGIYPMLNSNGQKLRSVRNMSHSTVYEG